MVHQDTIEPAARLNGVITPGVDACGTVDLVSVLPGFILDGAIWITRLACYRRMDGTNYITAINTSGIILKWYKYLLS